MTEKKTPRKPAGSTGFTAEERAAMKERTKELAAARRGSRTSDDGEAEVLAKIAEMVEPDRSMAQRLHELIRVCAPSLVPRTWYGMPAYAKDGNVLCFFQNAAKFKTRYSTLGFSDKAQLDDGVMWPTVYALADWTPDLEARIVALVSRAVG